MSLEPARYSNGRWRRGVSGNPGGRPVGPLVKHVRQLARSYTDEAVEALRGIMLNEDAQATAHVQAAKEILNRGWGQPSDEATLDALECRPDEAPITFVWPMPLTASRSRASWSTMSRTRCRRPGSQT